VGKKAVGRDVFREGALFQRGKVAEQKLKVKGQVKVTLLLTPEDVEKVENLQLFLKRRNYGNFTKSEIVKRAIRKLTPDDFQMKPAS
jgi:hypothetical protein